MFRRSRLMMWTAAAVGMMLLLPLTGAAVTSAYAQTTADACPEEVFLDVSQGSAGDGYPAAELSVSCDADSQHDQL